MGEAAVSEPIPKRPVKPHARAQATVMNAQCACRHAEYRPGAPCFRAPGLRFARWSAIMAR